MPAWTAAARAQHTGHRTTAHAVTFVLAALLWQQTSADVCLQQLKQGSAPAAWVHSLQRHSRELPDVKRTDLGAGDWEGGVWWNTSVSSLHNTKRGIVSGAEAASSEGPPEDVCREEWGIVRYKMYKGVLYSFSDDHTRRWHRLERSLVMYRNFLVEKLLAAMYLYKGFAEVDVDLFFCLWDVPCPCPSMHVPFLQHTAISHNISDNRYITPFNPSSLIQGGSGAEGSTHMLRYTQGFVIPYPEPWQTLSVSRTQLQAYSHCVATRYTGAARPLSNLSATTNTNSQDGAPGGGGGGGSSKEGGVSGPGWLSRRVPKLYWRGGATGSLRGWRPGAAGRAAHTHNQGPGHETSSSRLSSLLLNKRLLLTLMARPHLEMDVAVNRLRIDKTWGDPVNSDIDLALRREGLPLEEWSRHALTLSIDGFGPPWRLPQQYLGLTPVLKVESPYLEFFSPRFRPRKHYEPLRYDLGDVVLRTQQLLSEAQSNPGRLERMAAAARDVALDTFNFEAQMDCFVWSVLMVKEQSPWRVKDPSTLAASPMEVALTAAHWETLLSSAPHSLSSSSRTSTGISSSSSSSNTLSSTAALVRNATRGHQPTSASGPHLRGRDLLQQPAGGGGRVYAKQAGAGQWPEALGLRGRVSVRPVDMQRPQAGTVMGGGVRPLPLGYGLPVKYEASAPLQWRRVVVPRNYRWGSPTLALIAEDMRKALRQNFE